MNFKRLIIKDLIEWKKKKNRKPLILRGARQVGKTTLINEFAKEYSFYIYLNLEKEEDIIFFKEFSNVHDLIEALFLKYNIFSKDINNTLLFIDEIQESPKAIKLLRYFYEEIPKLNVIAAGSLLEFVMGKVKNFPVGRIEYLYLHPLNFEEYLTANNNINYLEHLNTVPVKKVAHNLLIKIFNKYAIIGGMPEIVRNYLNTKSISDLLITYESIIETYKNDIEKYAKTTNERKVIKHVIDTAHNYIDKRIKFQNFGNSNYRSREVNEAFRNLDAAKIIRIIYPTTNVEFPPMPDLKKSPRMQFLDTGLLNYSINIQADMLAINDLSSAYKGAIIPHLITQELISLNNRSNKKPVFWVREKTQSSAEVDLLFSYKNKLIPIEIKSGKAGTLRSLHQFIHLTNHPYALRIYGGTFSVEKTKTPSGKEFLLMNLPYYLGTKIPEYIKYFIENYTL